MEPGQPQVHSPIWQPPLSTLSENSALHCEVSTYTNVVFVISGTNYHVVCCYMRVRANDAYDNRHVRFTFLTY